MDLRERLKSSRSARAMALPTRLKAVARHNSSIMSESVHWLVRSKESTNFTYDLTDLNRDALVWFVARTTCRSYAEIAGYVQELADDRSLASHISTATAASRYSGVSDSVPLYGRRAGWYAMVRACKPTHVVESGVDKGLGTCVLASALLRNSNEGSPGTVTALDINPRAGFLVTAPYAEVVDLVIGDSVASIRALETPTDLFLQDSDHRSDHERRELEALMPHLTAQGVVLSDNAHLTSALSSWSRDVGRQFLYFQEQPKDHWYPGAGIGASTV